MIRETLLTTLKSYEKTPQTAHETTSLAEKTTIENDLNRVSFALAKSRKSSLVCKLYVFLLQKVFEEFSIPYFQGMMEVASVLLDAYFQDKANEFRIKNKHLDKLAVHPVRDNIPTKEEERLCSEFLSENNDLFVRFKNSLINILEQKFLFFTADTFKKYHENNEIFLEMMRSKFGRKLDAGSSIKYMNHTLTFFTRISENSDVAFKFLNLIFNSDPSIVFSILAVYIDKVEPINQMDIEDDKERAQFLVSSVDEEDIKKIMDTQKLFLETMENMNKSVPSKNTLIYAGVSIAFVVVAFAASKWYQNKEYDKWSNL